MVVLVDFQIRKRYSQSAIYCQWLPIQQFIQEMMTWCLQEVIRETRSETETGQVGAVLFFHSTMHFKKTPCGFYYFQHLTVHSQASFSNKKTAEVQTKRGIPLHSYARSFISTPVACTRTAWQSFLMCFLLCVHLTCWFVKYANNSVTSRCILLRLYNIQSETWLDNLTGTWPFVMGRCSEVEIFLNSIKVTAVFTGSDGEIGKDYHRHISETVLLLLNSPSTSSSSQTCLTKDAPLSKTASSSTLQDKKRWIIDHHRVKWALNAAMILTKV